MLLLKEARGTVQEQIGCDIIVEHKFGEQRGEGGVL